MGSRSPRESLEAFCRDVEGTYNDSDGYVECLLKSGDKEVSVGHFKEGRSLFVQVGEHDAEGRARYSMMGSVIHLREVKYHAMPNLGVFELTAENEHGGGLRVTGNGSTVALYRETKSGDGASVQGLVQWP